MSITKRQLAEQVMSLAGKRTPDYKFDVREVELLVGQVRDALAFQDYLQTLSATGEHQVPGELLTTFYELEVKRDEQRKRDYVVLPCQPLALPGGRGLFSVFTADSEELPFLIVRPGDQQLLGSHPAATLQGNPACSLEAGRRAETGCRLWMRQATKALYPKLSVQVVVEAATLAPNLPFTISSHLQQRVVDASLERLVKTPGEDRVPDSNDLR